MQTAYLRLHQVNKDTLRQHAIRKQNYEQWAAKTAMVQRWIDLYSRLRGSCGRLEMEWSKQRSHTLRNRHLAGKCREACIQGAREALRSKTYDRLARIVRHGTT